MPPSSLDLSSPLSLYSIPVVWFVGFYPTTWKFLTINSTMGYNNVQPRSNTSRFVDNKSISHRLAARVERMEGAHLNGNETFPLWAAAILAANGVGLGHKLMNTLSLGYIATRLLYNQVYINHETMGKGWIRTLIFFTSISMPITLLIKAAKKASRL